MPETLSRTFRFCPQCGASAQTTGVNPFRCAAADCSFTLFFSPITAVAAIVTDSENRVLFIRRAKDPGQGKLGLPGGFVDAGESLENALIREVFEETNLTAVAINYQSSFPNTYVYQGIALDVTDMFFSCQVASFDPLFARDGEAAGFHLAVPTSDDLNQMAFQSNRLALEKYLQNGDID